MTGPYAQQWGAARHPVQGLQCLRCHTLQPPLPPGHYTCVVCGAVLPLQRWVAHPPPGGPTRRRRAPRASWDGGNGRYIGPPSYRGSPPRWGFPPAVWQGPVADPEPPPNPARSLRGAATAAAIAAAVALLAAGAEIWRFVLMLEGRTQVLSGGAVRASDILVAASGLAMVVAAVAVVALAVPALIHTSRFAAARLGRTPPRGTRGLLLRLLVPGWNVYGAGQVAAEIDAMLGASSAAPRDPGRPGRLVLWWWASWVVNAAVLTTAVLRGGDSLQAIADTVELHIVLDVTAAVTSALLAALLLRFARLAIGRPATLGPWVVAPPSPTRGSAPAPAEQGGSPSTTGDAEGAPAAAPAPEDSGERAPQTREPAAH